MSADRQCANAECVKPLVQRLGERDRAYRRRATCDVSCGAKAGHQKHVALYGPRRGVEGAAKDDSYAPHWPLITGEFTGSFVGMDVATSDGYAQRLNHPVNHSGCGSAAVRCME